MNLDQAILRRFGELDAAAERIERTPSAVAGSDGVDRPLYQQWAVSSLSLIKRACGDDGVHATNFARTCQKFGGWRTDFRECRGVFNAAWEDYKGGYLFQIRALIDAEICGDVLEQADALLVAGYKDAACVIAGCSLEIAIREMAKARQIPEGRLDVMNGALAKAGAYNLGMQKMITAWADLRNRGAHGKWNEFGERDVRDLIDGVRRFIAEKM